MYNNIYERVYNNTIELNLTNERWKSNSYELVDSPSSAAFNLGRLSAGLYKYRAVTNYANKNFVEKGEFLVKQTQLEALQLQADHELLRSLSKKSDGDFYDFTDRETLTRIIEKITRLKERCVHRRISFLLSKHLDYWFDHAVAHSRVGDEEIFGCLLMSSWIGIDYGAKLSGYTAICFNQNDILTIQQCLYGKDADKWLKEVLTQHDFESVYIDAPLSLPGKYRALSGYNDFHYRKCDQELRAMSPLFLGGLTARAMSFSDEVEYPFLKPIQRLLFLQDSQHS